jgi:hypothetical protein
VAKNEKKHVMTDILWICEGGKEEGCIVWQYNPLIAGHG